MRTDDDDLLVEKAKAGDTSAFDRLIESHTHSLRTFVALRSPAPHLIDEIAHEALVYAFRHLTDYTGGSFASWLRAIATQLLRAETQRFARDLKRKHRYELDLLASRPSVEVLDQDEAAHLEECLKRVPSQLQLLLNLKYRERYSSQEISDRLSRSVAWVRTTLFRVREQLRTCLDAGAKP